MSIESSNELKRYVRATLNEAFYSEWKKRKWFFKCYIRSHKRLLCLGCISHGAMPRFSRKPDLLLL